MPEKKYILNDFFFGLPDSLIAQFPEKNRDESRLFIIDKSSGNFFHKKFHQLDNILNSGDILVFNNAKVIPARIYLKRASGGIVEILLNQKKNDNLWLALSNRTKRLKIGEIIHSIKNPSVSLKIIRKIEDFVEIKANVELTDKVLASIGEIPLPPYIKRDSQQIDKDRYQTIYASEMGAIASPTAGLHFTDSLFDRLKKIGIDFQFLTLNISWGTFQPVREKIISQHRMHKENYHLPDVTAKKINSARKKGNRIIAVGTSTLRVLESTYNTGENIPGYGETDLFIHPPYLVKSIDGMITNFHTPFSTLLMLVSAFAGYDIIMDAYSEAVKMKYRFFSYGDGMLILDKFKV